MQTAVMPKVGEIIKIMRERAHLSQDALAAKAGITGNSVSNIETGKSKRPNPGSVIAIVRALGFATVEEMAVEAGAIKPQWQSPGDGDPSGIPILSECPAGRGDFDPTHLGLDNGLGLGYIPRAMVKGLTDPLAYALVVKGDSMEPRYPDGCVVVCSPRAKHEPGKVYAIRFGSEGDDECTLKQVTPMDDGRLLIQPLNPAHKPRVVPRDWIVRMDRVIGRWYTEDE